MNEEPLQAPGCCSHLRAGHLGGHRHSLVPGLRRDPNGTAPASPRTLEAGREMAFPALRFPGEGFSPTSSQKIPGRSDQLAPVRVRGLLEKARTQGHALADMGQQNATERRSLAIRPAMEGSVIHACDSCGHDLLHHIYRPRPDFIYTCGQLLNTPPHKCFCAMPRSEFRAQVEKFASPRRRVSPRRKP